MKNSIFAAILLIVATLIILSGGGRVSPVALPLEHNGVHAPYNVRSPKGALLFYNMRAVEPNLLYRGSGFIRDRHTIVGTPGTKGPAPFADFVLFTMMKNRGIRTIVSLEEPEYFAAEKRYFDAWSKSPMNKSGYTIEVVNFPVYNGHAYDADTRALSWQGRGNTSLFGLRAAYKFIEFMKARKPSDGAVYIHCDTGKDRTGVVVAAYELWRNQGGVLSKDELWAQVMNRYLVSNTLISRDLWVSRFAGGKNACGAGEPANFVCHNWLNDIRPQLETLAQLY